MLQKNDENESKNKTGKNVKRINKTLVASSKSIEEKAFSQTVDRA